MEIALRLATSGDAEAIAGLVNRAYRPGAGLRGWTHEAELVAGERASAAMVRSLLRPGSALLVLCALGVGALLLAVPALRWAVLLAGVAYMLWLASRLAGSATLAQADAGRLDVGFWQGVLLQFVNIKAWMLALSIVAGWLAGRPDWLARFGLVLPVMVAYAFFSNLLYAAIGSLLRGWLAHGRRLLWFNRVMALALVATAAWMLWSAST